jgi:hypothetical protein
MIRSFSKWAGETHYANMKELVNQLDEVHAERLNEFDATPAMASMQKVAGKAGGAGAALRNMAKQGARTDLGDRVQNRMGMSNRRQTLKAALQTLGYEDVSILMRDVRSIAAELGVPGAEVAEDQEGIGHRPANMQVSPNGGDLEGMANNGAGANLGT